MVVGRLDDIIERNRNPRAAIRKRGGRRGVGLTGVVLFVVLVLMIFTDLAHPPDADDPRPEGPAAAPGGKVRGVLLGGPRRPGSSPSGVGSGSGSGLKH
jgi:hypothetical protein